MKKNRVIQIIIMVGILCSILVSNLIYIIHQKNISTATNISIVTSSLTYDKDEDAFQLYKGETKALRLRFEPLSITSAEVKWEIENSDIITMEGNLITGKKEGETTIKVALAQHPELSSEIKIKVVLSKPNITFTNPHLIEDNMEIIIGNMEEIKVSADCFYDPSDYEWISSDEDITVVHDGFIYAKALGISTISYRSKENSAIQHTIQVNVLSAYEKYIAKSIYVENAVTYKGKVYTLVAFQEMPIYVGDTFKLSLFCNPSTSYQGITAKSSDTSIFTVTQSAVVTARSVGKATLTFSSFYYPDVSCSIEFTVVGKNTTKISYSIQSTYFSKHELYDEVIMKVGEKVDYLCDVSPIDAYDTSVVCTWSMEIIQDNGESYVALKEGTTTLLITSLTNQNVYHIVYFRVIGVTEDYIPPTSLQFAKNQIYNEESKALTSLEKFVFVDGIWEPMFEYDRETIKQNEIEFDYDEAYLSFQDGKFTFLKAGVTNVTLRHKSYDLSQSITIHIYLPFELQLHVPEDHIDENGNFVMTIRELVTLTPTGNTNSYSLSLSDVNTLKISKTNIRAMVPGESTLFLRCTIDNQIYDQIRVIVYNDTTIQKITTAIPVQIKKNGILLENQNLLEKNHLETFEIGDVISFSMEYQSTVVTLENSGFVSINQVIERVTGSIESNYFEYKVKGYGRGEIKLYYFDLQEKAITLYINVHQLFPEGITFNQIDYLMTGDTFNLAAKPDGVDYTYGTLQFKSSDNTVASISNEGVITALKAGEVKICIYIQDLFDYMAEEFILPIIDKNTGIEVTQYQITTIMKNEEIIDRDSPYLTGESRLKVDDILNFDISILPFNTTNDESTVSVSNAKTLEISKSNRFYTFKALSPGHTTVTITWNKIHKISYQFVLNIQNEEFDPIVYDLSEIQMNEKRQIRYTLKQIKNASVSFSIEDENVAYIDSYGTIFGKMMGDTTVHMMVTDGVDRVEFSIPVKIIMNQASYTYVPVESPSILLSHEENEEESFEFYVNEDIHYQLVSESIHPTFESNLRINPAKDELRINQDSQIITCTKPGEYEWIFTIYDREKVENVSAFVRIIDRAPEFVIFDSPKGYLNVGEKFPLNLLIDQHATNPVIYYTYSNSNIVKIENQEIKAKSAGFTTVTMHVKQENNTELIYEFDCIVLDMKLLSRSFSNFANALQIFLIHFLFVIALALAFCMFLSELKLAKWNKVILIILGGPLILLLFELLCLYSDAYVFDGYKVALLGYEIGVLLYLFYILKKKMKGLLKRNDKSQ